MKTFCLSDMTKGWFVGNFEPTCFKTDQFEVACKYYKKGDHEKPHIHKVAREITLIVQGVVMMNGERFEAQDIIFLEPGERADFEVLEDAVTVVVKNPCVSGDKYCV